MYSVHSFWTTHSQRGSRASGSEGVEVPALARAVAVHHDDLGRARGAGSPDRGVDLLGVQAPRLLEERLAAVALLGLDDS